MPRPKTISSAKILDAAREIFLERGYGVSAAAIAKKAGVSEGTVFKRFETKEKLFRAAMGLPRLDMSARLAELEGKGDPKENVVSIAMEFLEFLRQLVPRTMHLCAHPSFDPVASLRNETDAPPLRLLRQLTNYFDAEMRLGRIRTSDPEVVARALMGTLHNYVFLDMIGAHERMPFAPATYVRALVELLWQGLEPGE